MDTMNMVETEHGLCDQQPGLLNQCMSVNKDFFNVASDWWTDQPPDIQKYVLKKFLTNMDF